MTVVHDASWKPRTSSETDTSHLDDSLLIIICFGDGVRLPRDSIDALSKAGYKVHRIYKMSRPLSAILICCDVCFMVPLHPVQEFRIQWSHSGQTGSSAARI